MVLSPSSTHKVYVPEEYPPSIFIRVIIITKGNPCSSILASGSSPVLDLLSLCSLHLSELLRGRRKLDTFSFSA